jgi:hypothetical protein
MTLLSLLNRLDWEPFSETGIELSAEQIDRAIELAQPITDPDQQWQTYLHLLALLGFEQWMSERSPDLSFNVANCALLQPQTAARIGSVCNLEIGGFKVGLIAMGSLADTIVSVPSATIDIPDYAAQFYILVEVLEEQQQVQIQGYLRADQLQANQQALMLQADQTYALPIDWFSLDADNLLLNLRCLELTAIPLPALQSTAQSTAPSTTAQLAAEHRIETTSTDILSNIQDNLRESSASIIHNVLNVAAWMQGQLDEVAQQLAWVLLPPAMQPAALRSSVAEWDLLLDNLMQSGLHIPETAARAYRDFDWEGNLLRLHAITWELDSLEPEWVLLLVLGGQATARLPMGSRLQVRDASQILVERQLTDSDRIYLYAQVVGSQNEQFWVSIGSNTSMFSLPPFAFRL